MSHQQGSSCLEEVEYFLTKGQPRVTRIQWSLMPLGFYHCFTLCLTSVLTKALQTREVAFADDVAVVRKLADIKNFWDKLVTIGPKNRYFPKFT